MAARPYMLRSKTTEYQTPPDLFDELWDEFGPFDLDPCCRPEHYTASRIVEARGSIYVPSGLYDEPPANGQIEIDGLARGWFGRVYMNPPYNKAGKWVEKAVHEVECGNAELVVALLAARTDTKWWQQYVLKTLAYIAGNLGWTANTHVEVQAVRFLPGRLKFGGAKNSAPFPSVVVVWRR